MENNLKAERLEQYINAVNKKHLTEAFIFHLFISTHIYTNIYTHNYPFDDSYIIMEFLIFLYQLDINQFINH